MRLLTLNILRKCKFKPAARCACAVSARQLSNDVLQPRDELEVEADTEGAGAGAGGGLVEVCGSWGGGEHAELRARVLRDLRVLPDFVSAREEEALLAELEPVLRRMRYQFDHWDNAIHGYRETERAQWSDENETVLQRVRARAFGPRAGAGAAPLPAAHVLDLAPAGHIKPHVDAVRFCGGVIAGLCLSSPAVMRLQHAAPARAHLALHALLPRRALYIMKGSARYEFTHAVLGGAESAWRGQRVLRARRVAVIVRARPDPAAHPPPPGDVTAE